MKTRFLSVMLVGGAVMLIATSVYRIPHGVHFSAPHQSALSALASRIEFNRAPAARVVYWILSVSLPVVYAEVVPACGGHSKPPCDGYKPTPEGNPPYCAYDPIHGDYCSKETCAYAGGARFCKGRNFECILYPPGGKLPCHEADSVACQK